MTAQAFRPHVIDMFEPQVHPDVFPIPGGPPTPPYDNAGWTLAMQMGVKYDRILDGFTGPFEPVTDWNAKPMAGRITSPNGAAGFVASRRTNDAFVAMNRLMKAGEEVYALKSPLTVGGVDASCGHVVRALEGHDAPRARFDRRATRRELRRRDRAATG